MTIYDNIREKKLQYDIKQKISKVSKISGSSSGKNDKYEYLTS